MAPWPTVYGYKVWARIAPADTTDDQAIGVALAAATDAVQARCPALDPLDCPDDVHQATLLWTNRLMARRNSPSGVIGLDDTGQAVVPGRDPDIRQLLAPWRAQVIG